MENRKITIKCISYILCAVLMFGLMSGVDGRAQALTEKNVDTLKNLIDTLQSSDSEIQINLNGNISVTEIIVIPAGKTVTITSVSFARTLMRGDGYDGFLFVNYGSLTLTNVVVDGNYVTDVKALIYNAGELNIGDGAILQNSGGNIIENYDPGSGDDGDGDAELTDDEKKAIAEINHADSATGITVSGDSLPWYVQINVLIPETEEEYTAFLEKIDIPESEFELLVLYDIKLLDTLKGEYYEPAEGETLTIEMDNVSLTGVENIAVAHEKKNGTIEILPAEIVDGKVVFAATSFSLYGVLATNRPNIDLGGNKDFFGVKFYGSDPGAPRTGDSSNATLWFVLGGAALIIICGLAVVKLRRKRSDI